MSKRLVVCCDGTWQNLESSYPTNVVKTVQAIPPTDGDGVAQLVYYDAGVGTASGDRITGGAFGWGLSQNILDSYRFLCLNYEEGDQIYLFGFSRGAYTVRSLAGLIRASGLLSREWIRLSDEAYELYRDGEVGVDDAEAIAFRSRVAREIDIDFLGCWDTVGSLGVPDQIPWLPIDNWVNRKYTFHDPKVSRKIRNARHAVAIDEHRGVFDVTHMEGDGDRIKHMWFVGDHGAVGGGSYADRGLADLALLWMWEECEAIPELGLTFDVNRVPTRVEANATGEFDNAITGIYRLTRKNYREITGTFDNVHESVKKRWNRDPQYRPRRLKERFGSELDAWEEASVTVT